MKSNIRRVYDPQRPAEAETLKPVRKWFWLSVMMAVLLLLPSVSLAQTGTLTDDAYTSTNAKVQSGNFSGSGPAIVVSGSNATISGKTAGPANGYIKFKLTPSLPPGTTDTNVAKATLKLYVNYVTNPSSFNIFRITGAWSESTITSTTSLTLIPEGAGVSVTSPLSFVTIDLTQLVKDWLSGAQPNNGIALQAGTATSFISFDSKESPITSHEPRLEITLVNQGAQGASRPSGSGGSPRASRTSGAARTSRPDWRDRSTRPSRATGIAWPGRSRRLCPGRLDGGF